MAACDGRTGLVPANYIKVLGKTEGKQVDQPDVVQVRFKKIHLINIFKFFINLIRALGFGT